MTTPSTSDRYSALTSTQRVTLMRRLVEAGRTAQVPAVVPPRDAGAPVPLSPAQLDLWVYESLYPGTPNLNLCCAYHFDTPVDPAHLEAALSVVQANHDILRTRIGGPAGELRLSFPDSGPLTLEREDLRGTGRTVEQAFAAFRRRPFDLRGRLMRGRLVQRDDRRSTLMLSLHHIITDWWSFDVLQDEFTRAYLAVRGGGKPDLVRPPLQYADFACWQAELEQSGVFGARLDFWSRYLADPPGPLTAPGAGTTRGTGAGGDAGAVDAGHGPGIVQLPFRVGPRTTAAVRALARAHGVSVYVVLMSAFAALAHKVTGAQDLVLGTPVANRSAKGLDRVIGYVMNAVPTRWRTTPDTAFADLVARFGGDFPALLANADLPVGRIVSAVAPERSAGRSPLFQWVFMHLTEQPSVSALREFVVPERIHTGGEHDLVAVVRDSGQGMDGSFEIRADQLDPASVAHWTRSYLALLDQVAEHPGTLLADLDLLPEGEQQRLLAAATGPAAPAPSSLPELLARQAARTPDAPALEAEDGCLSYAQLADRVDRLAARLAAGGAAPERIVAVALGRGALFPVAALAVQRAGAAYLPVDPDHPADRISRILAEAAPVLLVTDAATARRLPDTGVPVLLLDQDAYRAEPLDTALPDPALTAYVIHTSGSTGTPKGVVSTHQGVAALTRSLVDRFELTGADRILQLGAPTFDISVAELCMAIGSGATLVVPPGGPLLGADLGRVLSTRRVSFLLVPPSILATVPDGRYPRLRALAVGAEACPPDLVARWATGGRRLHNAYGPTESTVAATVTPPLGADGTAPPIGTPLAGTRGYVLDARLRMVPTGVAGELYLAGDGLARGYLNRSGATAERFTADPYGEPGSRMYRTGDLAYRTDDGAIHYLGRSDDQVKLRGLRIEPGEVAAALAAHPQVAGAAAVVREERDGRRRLIGYAVPAPGAAPDPDTLLAHTALRLPAHMTPADVVLLDALPLTSSGKLDRAALPAPRAVDPTGGRSPATPAERTLCALFADLLDSPRHDPDADFFRLGGDSIMAIQLAGRASAAGLVLAPADVFAARTPARLALLARTPEPDQPGESDAATGVLPLTPVMCWWRDQDPDLEAFTQSMVFPLPPGTRPQRVTAAVRGLVERHPALRMRLLRPEGADWQLEALPYDPAAVRPQPVDATADADPVQVARRLAEAVRIDPHTGPLLRAALISTGPDHPDLLLLTAHHLAVDGVSWRVLDGELAAALAAPDGHRTAAAPGTSFRRWARALQRQARRPELTDGATRRWAAALTAAPGDPAGPDTFLPGAAANRCATARRAVHTLELPTWLSAAVLGTLPDAFSCGADAVLLTALTLAVVRQRGAGSGLLVHLEGHGREPLAEPADVSRTVGWFTTQYPVRLDLGAAATALAVPGADPAGPARAALQAVKEQLRAVPHGGMDWGLLRYLNPATGPALAALPVPDVRFNYLGRLAAGDAAGGRLLSGGAEAVPLRHALEVDVLAHDRHGAPCLEATLSYPEGLLHPDQVREFAHSWTLALELLAEHAERGGPIAASPTDFPLVELTPEQLGALEADFGDLGEPDGLGTRNDGWEDGR